MLKKLEMFYLNSTLNFGIPLVLVFQLEAYYKVDRLLTGLTAQQKGTPARCIQIKHLYACLFQNGIFSAVLSDGTGVQSNTLLIDKFINSKA